MVPKLPRAYIKDGATHDSILANRNVHAKGLLSKVTNHLLDHSEDLHNIAINVRLPRLLQTATKENRNYGVSELPSMAIIIHKPIFILNKDHTLISRYNCSLKHSS